jgi:hypothetical protein
MNTVHLHFPPAYECQKLVEYSVWGRSAADRLGHYATPSMFQATARTALLCRNATLSPAFVEFRYGPPLLAPFDAEVTRNYELGFA